MKILITLLAMVLPWAALGKAAFFGKEAAIRKAEIIAIVDIEKVEPTEKKTKGWTYSEVAEAKVDRVLKGELPGTVRLHGGENFICAQVKYKPGKHLVFLHKDGDLITGVNWHLGALPITGDSVQWFATDASIELKPTPLRNALKDIETAVANDWPILVHVRHGSRDPLSTLKFAYWQDGTVLFRSPKDDALQVGHIAYPEFWKMWTAFREAGFFKTTREHYVVPDSSYETIIIHLGSESALHSWHGSLTRGFGGDIETDPEYRAFVEMWSKTVGAISETAPTGGRSVNDVAKSGNFRGYVLNKPNETKWLNEGEWRSRMKGE